MPLTTNKQTNKLNSHGRFRVQSVVQFDDSLRPDLLGCLQDEMDLVCGHHKEAEPHKNETPLPSATNAPTLAKGGQTAFGRALLNLAFHQKVRDAQKEDDDEPEIGSEYTNYLHTDYMFDQMGAGHWEVDTAQSCVPTPLKIAHTRRRSVADACRVYQASERRRIRNLVAVKGRINYN